MKQKRNFILVILIAILAISIIDRFFYSYDGKNTVARVIDGDTIELSNGSMIRYIGVNTPEIRRKAGEEWVYDPMPYAEKAKDFNEGKVLGRQIDIEYDIQRKDKYGRILGYVYIGNIMVNAELIKNGYSVIYSYPPNIKHLDDFLNAQEEARVNKRGIWKDLEDNIISSKEAKDNFGLIKMIDTDIVNTYISEKVLILRCPDDFNIVIFRSNFNLFPKDAIRSPDSYFRYKRIKVYGLIREHKKKPEIIVYHPSQFEVI
ncbi:MAG: thermonuclease family protein [Candidatus Omnitrophota bacterium]